MGSHRNGYLQDQVESCDLYELIHEHPKQRNMTVRYMHQSSKNFILLNGGDSHMPDLL